MVQDPARTGGSVQHGRIAWIDVAKGIAMLLVFYGHLPGSGDNPWFPDLMTSRSVVYLFHMPLFFVLSGITFHPSKGFKQFAGSRLRRLIVPYYFFSLYALMKIVLKVVAPAIFASFHGEAMGSWRSELLNIVLGNSIGLWFFWALFWGDLVLWVLAKFPKAVQGAFCLLCLLAWPFVPVSHVELPFQLWGVFEAVAFTGLGWLLSGTLEKENRMASSVFLIISMAVFAVSACIALSPSHNPIKVYVVKLFAAVSGSLMIVFLAKGLIQSNSLLQYIGRDTLIFYGLNGLSLAVSKGVFFRIVPVSFVRSNVWSQLLAGMIVLCLACLLCAALKPLIHRYCWWAIGSTNPVKKTVSNN